MRWRRLFVTARQNSTRVVELVIGVRQLLEIPRDAVRLFREQFSLPGDSEVDAPLALALLRLADSADNGPAEASP